MPRKHKLTPDERDTRDEFAARAERINDKYKRELDELYARAEKAKDRYDYFATLYGAQFIFDEWRAELWALTVEEAEATGREMFYDLSDGKRMGIGCGRDCEEDCTVEHTVILGVYRMRPKTPGGGLPARQGRITGLSANGLGDY